MESLVLAVLGSVAGLGLSYAAIRLLQGLGPSDIPRLAEVGLDPGVLLFALAATFVTSFTQNGITKVSETSSSHGCRVLGPGPLGRPMMCTNFEKVIGLSGRLELE
jgi:hypothetical protein